LITCSSSSSSGGSSDAEGSGGETKEADQKDAAKRKAKARRQAKKNSLSKACAAKELSKEELERGPPECRVPICPKCGAGVLKPDGIFFGESLVPTVLQQSVRQSAKSKVVLMVGTSGTVDPAAKLPLIAKKKSGAWIVEVNTAETRLSPIADIRLLGASAIVLPKVLRLVASHPRIAELRALREDREKRLAGPEATPKPPTAP